MKKIFSLIIRIGLLLSLVLTCISPARAIDIPPGDPVTNEDITEPEQDGPPWYSEAWHYRRPVIISNSGAYIPYYQVLVKLDSGNFNFERAKPDGSDVRFTDSTGKNLISYWIESWDRPNQLAYLWVLVSSISTEPNDTTIYLYYDNPAATPVSDGKTTFDGFEDNWSQFTSAEFNQDEETLSSQFPGEVDNQIVWSGIGGLGWPTASSGILSLNNGTGIRSTSIYNYGAMGFKAYFSSGGGNEAGGFFNDVYGHRTMIGDLSSPLNNDIFLIDYVTVSENIKLLRVGGIDWHNAYHIYEVRWNPGKSTGDIDHGASYKSSTLPAQVPSSPPNLPVRLFSYTGSNATLLVDWVYVRQYREPEPTTLVSTEQGLVELGISMIDFPDPLPKNRELTYQLTISNNSIIEAPGVIVTDTIPAGAQFVTEKSSQGCTPVASDIICSLNPIAKNSTVSVTIVVKPNADGWINNTAIVGSPGYELDMSNNSSSTVTLVDSVPPVVEWKSPVKEEETYHTLGGNITLIVTATDNDQVNRVEFKLWDHLVVHNFVLIGIDYTSPYQVVFNSDALVPCPKLEPVYQMYAFVYDRAGNVSYPRVFIERICPHIYIPIVVK